MKKLLIAILISPFLFNFALFAQDDWGDEDWYDDESYQEGWKDDDEKPYDKFMATLQAGFNFTFGQFQTFYGHGLGVTGGLQFNVTREFSIAVKSGYLWWSTEGDNKEDEYLYDVFPVNLQLFFFIREDQNLVPYFGLETGMNFITFTYKEMRFNEFNRRTVIEHDTQYSDFGMAPTAGIMWPAGIVNFNINVQYQLIFHDFQTENLTFLAINGGVSLPF